jgi:hypothetical protein
MYTPSFSLVSCVLFAHLPHDYPAENSIYYSETLRSSGIGLVCMYKGLEAGIIRPLGGRSWAGTLLEVVG